MTLFTRKYPKLKLSVVCNRKYSAINGEAINEFDIRRGGFLGLFAETYYKPIRASVGDEQAAVLLWDALTSVGVPISHADVLAKELWEETKR